MTLLNQHQATKESSYAWEDRLLQAILGLEKKFGLRLWEEFEILIPVVFKSSQYILINTTQQCQQTDLW